MKQESPIHLDVSTWGAAIFDMDGVVVDTVPIHFRTWKKMAEDYARAFTFEDYKAKVDGIPRIDGARAILEGMETASSSRMRFWGSRRQSGPECSVWASIAVTLPTVWRRQILSSVTWPR